MKFKSIQTKIIFWTGVCVIFTVAFILIYTLLSAGKDRMFVRQKVAEIVEESTLNRLTSEARSEAANIQEKLGTALYTAHSLAQTFKGIKIEEEDGETMLEISRTELGGILNSVIEQHKDFLGIYTCWEPYGLDALDDSYKNDVINGYDETGRFIPYYSWNDKKDRIKRIALKDYENTERYPNGVRKGEFYLRPRETKQVCLIDPFPYIDGEKKVWRISIAAPIRYKEKFYGVVGVDLDLNFLQDMAINLNKNLYGGRGQIAIISYQGILSAYSREPDKIGNHIREVFPNDWKSILDKTINRGEFLYKVDNNDDGDITVYMPIEFAHTTANWAVLIEVPIAIVMEDANALDQTLLASGTKNLTWQVIVSSTGVAVLCFALFSLLSFIVIKPLNKTVGIIKEIAKGDLSLRIHSTSNDEISALGDALDTMADALENRSMIAQAIALGNLSQEVVLLSEKDRFGKAYQIMIDSLNSKAKAAEGIAEGYLDQLVEIASENDKLGKSFQVMVENIREVVQQANVIAQGDYSADIVPRSEKDELRIALREMTLGLREMSEANEKQNWIKTGQTNLSEKISGEQRIDELCLNAITYIAKYIGAQVGTIYIKDVDRGDFKLIANYAFMESKGLANRFKPGEGLVGQAALEKDRILFAEVPDGYIKIESSLGNSIPKNILVLPLVYEEDVKGVIELGASFQFTALMIEFADLAGGIAAVAINAALSNEQLKKLFDQTKEQTEVLKESEGKLQLQQEELQASNEELEEKTELLERQKNEIEKKNQVLQGTQIEIEKKARQLELATRYKSEFLSNMSHELRTPLNSVLLLAKMLSDNEENNLTDDQVESASSIHRSGQNLLYLINDILDLSKIEAKKIELSISRMKINTFVSNFKTEFRHVAKQKGLDLNTAVQEGLPDTIVTDIQRLEQIIRNLLGNAFKFTESGSVSLGVARPDGSVQLDRKDLNVNKTMAISVSDTGKGIAEDQLMAIFEPFKQVDGSITRLHGGTGLGLSISKELALLIGGELRVESTLGNGTVFTLYIPEVFSTTTAEKKDTLKISGPEKGEDIKEDRLDKTEQPDKTLSVETPEIVRHSDTKAMLIIEDDNEFAGILADFFQKNGYESIIASNGETGIKYVIEHSPTAIILDIGLPGIDGWSVLNELKSNPDTRHIPVHIMSAYDNISEGLHKGAVGYLTKPISTDDLKTALIRIEGILTNEVKELLVVEDDETLRESILKLMGTNDIHATATGTGEEALDLMKIKKLDCMILDLGLPDISGFELLDKINSDTSIEKMPVIIYTGRDLTKEETDKLERYSSSIVLKKAVSMERLLDETALFMHRVESDLPENQQKMIRGLRDRESILAGKSVLIVDDDMRNAFALNKFLTSRGMDVSIADNGKKALELLEKGEKTDIILMDIMMPVMDGHEAMKRIRKQKRFEDIPILALTAKAMESDREECIKSGANDYLSKPVDVTKLLSMLRVWLY